MIILQIARIIANFSLFLELTDDEILDPDAAVEMDEFLGASLVALDKGFLRELVDAFQMIAPEYSGEAQQVVRDLAFGYFLEEAIAADDPVKLAELEALRDAREV
jgi:hypothetical protein